MTGVPSESTQLGLGRHAITGSCVTSVRATCSHMQLPSVCCQSSGHENQPARQSRAQITSISSCSSQTLASTQPQAAQQTDEKLHTPPLNPPDRASLVTSQLQQCPASVCPHVLIRAFTLGRARLLPDCNNAQPFACLHILTSWLTLGRAPANMQQCSAFCMSADPDQSAYPRQGSCQQDAWLLPSCNNSQLLRVRTS